MINIYINKVTGTIASSIKRAAYCIFLHIIVTNNTFATTPHDLSINEIMQSNIYTVFADMDFPDSWVELYNQTENSINIKNYYISPTSDYNDGYRIKTDEDYVWANYNGEEDIEMIESLNATTPASYKDIKDAIISGKMSYEEAALHIDMDNMADMIAINTICANTDWPYNNVSMWKPIEYGGKWRWIMKDMDMINAVFRCTSPLTFNYLKYLTNTSELGSQEYDLHQSNTWIWPSIKLIGKIVTMPGFQEALVDRLMVFMGDFMRGDVLQKYLDAQYESLNTEVTQSLIMLKTCWERTFYNSVQNYKNFFYARPAEVYQHVTDYYHLGHVIPMKTTGLGLSVSINDIPLTEGDFNGACFSDRAIRLDSGDENTGWLMHVKRTDNLVISYGFETPNLNLIPKDYQPSANESIASIEFEVCPINEVSTIIKEISSQCNIGSHEIDAIYSIDGKTAINRKSGAPYIIHYKMDIAKK